MVIISNFYWYGSSGDWPDYTNHWSGNSGNSPADPKAAAPTSSDDVFIDANSGFGAGGTITVDATVECNNFVASSGHTYRIDGLECDFNVYGSFTLESGIAWRVSNLYFLSTSSGKTITTDGVVIGVIKFNGVSGGWTLQDDLKALGQFYQQNGTFDANDHNVTANDFYFYANTGYTPTVIMGSGTWEATGKNDIWGIDEKSVWNIDENSGQVVTITKETSTIKTTDATETAKTFVGGGKTYNNLLLTGIGTGNFIITGSNTFNDFKCDTPPHTIKFADGITVVVNTFTVSGTDGNLITLDNLDGVTQFTLSKPSGIVSCDYLDISNSNATGGATWYAGSHSLDTTNNDGWLFPTAPTITLLGENPISTVISNSYTDAGATATDTIDGNLTSSIVTVNPVNINTVGVYTITYNVTNSFGQSATQVTRTVNVINNTAPEGTSHIKKIPSRSRRRMRL